MKLATEPSRTDPLTAYSLTRVLPGNTLNGKLTPTTRRLKSARSLSIPGAEAGWAKREGHPIQPRGRRLLGPLLEVVHRQRHSQIAAWLQRSCTLSAARGARGPMATREEYLARSKEAAIALLEGGDSLAAIALMISDLRHLDGFDAETQRILIADAVLSRNTTDQIREWINGFN